MTGRVVKTARAAVRFAGYASVVLVAACGGGSSGSTPTTPTATTNSLQVTVDAGPAALTSQNYAAANTLYTTITVCTPGSTTACQTIDHVQVDTGSVGLQLFAEALSGAAVPTPLQDAATGGALRECVVFVDGYTWGSMALADVAIGGRTLSKLPVHLIGDAAAGTAPQECQQGPSENTVFTFGANGVLGVGNWLQDCGPACVNGVVPKTYYACSATSCTGTTVALKDQVQNPIAMLSSDNNGVVIHLPSVSAPGASSVTGTLYFGIGTQSNNSLGSASFFTLDGYGDLITTYGTATLSSSFIDSGSNAYFFDSSTITACTSKNATGFYCPAASTAQSATIQGFNNGVTRTVDFTVDNADNLFAVNATAYPNLAGPNSAANASSGSFDWGLPFFYGRPVFVLFESNTVGGTTGPAVGF